MMLILPALILGIWAQYRVKSTYAKYGAVRAAKGIKADQVSRMLLDSYGLAKVPVEHVAGDLTDHYDPRSKKLRLSESVYGNPSIAAIGVAAHEVGHAVQDLQGYMPLKIRNTIVPAVNFTSAAAIPLFFIGLIFRSPIMMDIGIVFFLGVIAFHLVTLPVELDASSKAMRLIADTGVLSVEEAKGAKAVLNAAALTYVAAAVMAVAQLLRLLALRGRSN